MQTHYKRSYVISTKINQKISFYPEIVEKESHSLIISIKPHKSLKATLGLVFNKGKTWTLFIKYLKLLYYIYIYYIYIDILYIYIYQDHIFFLDKISIISEETIQSASVKTSPLKKAWYQVLTSENIIMEIQFHNK